MTSICLRFFPRTFAGILATESSALLWNVNCLAWRHTQLLAPTVCGTSHVQTRNYSFFTKLTANEIWQGVSGVSNAGRKRGRGKRGSGRRQVDLNRGQVHGEGRGGMVWPGLNAPVMKGRELVKIRKEAPNQQRIEELQKLRDKSSKFRQSKIPALQRGWTGAKFPGRSIGPPDPIGDYKFDGFDTRILEFKMVTNMTGNLGRKQKFSCFVVTGNQKGLAGYALGKAPNARAAMRKARNRAGQVLHYIERYEDHTVFHNFHTKERQTSIFVKKKEKGFGVVCHRALKTICEVIGIDDLYCQVEGSTKNIQNLTKAFFAGLINQETHQELADRLKLNVVEFRKETDFVPRIVASPTCEARDTLEKDENLDFENLYYGGKLEYYKKKPAPFYKKLPCYKWKQVSMHKSRNQRSAQLQRLALGIEPSNKSLEQ
ncbi:hypothetical protein ScPMuIL_013860 [Solemya velum]